jgi:hypothetical protein
VLVQGGRRQPGFDHPGLERNAEQFQAFADLASVLLSYRRWAKPTN